MNRRQPLCVALSIVSTQIALGLCAAPADAGVFEYGDTIYKAELRGDQVVPNVSTNAIGAGTFTIDKAANTLTYRISYTGLSGAETAARLHGPANPGQNGTPLLNLPLGTTKTGVWNYPPSIEQDLINGRVYVSIASAGFPNGEIRGQLGQLVSTLDGFQQVPTNGSSGKGWATFTFNRQTNVLKYHINISGLTGTETGAAVHIGDLHGGIGTSIFDLPAGPVKTGQYTFLDGDEEFSLTNGRAWINVRSTAFPDGEIRGQICNILVILDGSQEVPPVITPGLGIAHLSMCTHCNLYTFLLKTFNLSSPVTVAHVHGYSPIGQSSLPQIDIPAGNPVIGMFGYGLPNEPAVMNGLTYLNVHTVNNPNGEVRGQVIPGTPFPMCASDMNNDGVVDGLDLGQLLSGWSATPKSPGCRGFLPCPPDLNLDGLVNGLDLGQLLNDWSLPAMTPGCQ